MTNDKTIKFSEILQTDKPSLKWVDINKQKPNPQKDGQRILICDKNSKTAILNTTQIINAKIKDILWMKLPEVLDNLKGKYQYELAEGNTFAFKFLEE